ncbi:MAG: hypothetical protein M3R53_00375 [Candidatus Eremiobacteraeota bacterium]|nr:hypothetical protein [Candidatus Eremiobacteraeota bacterium]
MHKHLYLVFTLAGTLLVAPFAAFAQNAAAPAPNATIPAAGTSGHHRGSAMRHALKTLGLSADQKTRIKEIMTSYRASRHSASPQTRRQLRANIEGVLTPDQRTRFAAAMQQQARSRSQGARAPQPVPTS